MTIFLDAFFPLWFTANVLRSVYFDRVFFQFFFLSISFSIHKEKRIILVDFLSTDRMSTWIAFSYRDKCENNDIFVCIWLVLAMEIVVYSEVKAYTIHYFIGNIADGEKLKKNTKIHNAVLVDELTLVWVVYIRIKCAFVSHLNP